MTTAFTTTAYRAAHGKAPRGTGCWAFMPNTTAKWVFSPPMSYSNAKAWAKAQHPTACEFTVGS
jgi:hypothetical protein